MDVPDVPVPNLSDGLWIHHPYEGDGTPVNLGSRGVSPCAATDTFARRDQGIGGGGALISESEEGCSNANTSQYFPREGPYALSVWVRLDAPAAGQGQTVVGLSLPTIVAIEADDRGDLLIRLGPSEREVTRVLVASAVGSGWHHVGLRVNPSLPLSEVFLGGLKVFEAPLSPGTRGSLNGRTADWIGGLDELRTYARCLTDTEFARLAEP